MFRSSAAEKLSFSRISPGFSHQSARFAWTALGLGLMLAGCDNARSQEVSLSDQARSSGLATVEADVEPRLTLNFSNTPWNDVLQWLTEEAGLSLQKDTDPRGTFSYVDPRRGYTVDQAIDAMNLVLWREGFSLVRRNQQLMLIDLEDKLSAGYLQEIADQVTPEELDERSSSDYVRVTFSLGAMTPEEAVADLEKLRSPIGVVLVLGSSRKVIVTDTVSKLRTIRSVLSSADGIDGPVLEINLEYRAAEELLELARPHLGLEPGANQSETINLSTNLMGDRIYATGDPLKLSLLKGLVAKGDKPLPTIGDGETANVEEPVLENYGVGSADPVVAMDVVSRLLAGMPDVRMTLDAKTNQIIALARPSEHKTIVGVLAKLTGESSNVEVLTLRKLDPVSALQTINKYFGKTAENNVGPTVDGDPVTKKLWVRGTTSEIAQVKELIEMLEGSSTSGMWGDRVRILPFTGRSAEEALRQVESLWELGGRSNRIRMVTPSDGAASAGGLQERRLNEPTSTGRRQEDNGPAKKLPQQTDADDSISTNRLEGTDYVLVSFQHPQTDPAATEPTVKSETTRTAEQSTADVPQTTMKSRSGADIIVQMTPQGMVVISDDPEALAEFEEMMAMVTDSSAAGEVKPTVYWLKYIKAPVASDLLNNILSGAGSSSGGIGDMAGSMLGELGGGMLGGLLGMGGGGGGGGGDGPVLTTTGTVSIVPDARLNALIIQANATDLLTVESILQVIDREESPEDVRTSPKPELIPVIYQDANDVATLVKGVYAERIAGAQGQQQRQPSPQELIAALRGGGGGRGGAKENEDNKPVPISISVDTRSNSLIVAAPPQDLANIRELVETIDQGGMENEDDVVVLTLNGNINPSIVQSAISAILGPQAKTGTTDSVTTTSSSSSNATAGSAQASPSDIQQRIEMFRQMQSRGGIGGGASPFGGGGRGGRGGGTGGGGRSGPPFGGGGRGGR